MEPLLLHILRIGFYEILKLDMPPYAVVDEEKISKKFDKVLLDAPCFGLGVLSKRVDLRWNRRLEDLEQLTNLQDELFDAASLLVKPGGTLVYSTCSIDPEENEGSVAAFLLKHSERPHMFQFVPSRELVKAVKKLLKMIPQNI
ncbi:uncharacterized protein LOC131255727 [Magnolia sinica]|uniref:uncharacterized protein LOC131255727 n=1 Tax=Magnolia sinica TaxID=86752 RepID=UPI00265946ED|nr:uncharacterized protein LOC131255727 [Magnolia sinica]